MNNEEITKMYLDLLKEGGCWITETGGTYQVWKSKKEVNILDKGRDRYLRREIIQNIKRLGYSIN